MRSFGRTGVAALAVLVAAGLVGCGNGSEPPSGTLSPGATGGGGGTGGGTGGGGGSGRLQVSAGPQFPQQQGGDGGVIMHTATLLDDGRVLIVGGLVPDPAGPNGQGPGASIGYYLYDATANTLTDSLANVQSVQQLQNAVMTAPGQMDIGNGQVVPFVIVFRMGHTATLLQNGQVLICGGYGFDRTDTANQPIQEVLSSAHLFDPASNTFTLVQGRMQKPRAFHQAVRLANGKVLITGGIEDDGILGGQGTATSVKEAEIYDPSTQTFSPAGSLENGLIWAASSPVQQGAVIWGGLEYALDPQTGQNAITVPLNANQTQINVGFAYDGSQFTIVHSTGSGDGYNILPAAATIGGTFFMAGGWEIVGGQLAGGTSVLMVDTLMGGYLKQADIQTGRLNAAGAELGSGLFLITGGSDGNQNAPTMVTSAELYDNGARQVIETIPMLEPRLGHSCVRLKNGAVAAIGGTHDGTDFLGFDGFPAPTIEVYTR